MQYNPLVQAGNLIVAKAPKALNSISGSKKSRWFELDGDNLTCLNQKKGDPKTSVASFLDIREFTTNSVIANSFPFAFEIETLYRTMSFGCDTQLTRDKWVTALTTAREVLLFVLYFRIRQFHIVIVLNV